MFIEEYLVELRVAIEIKSKRLDVLAGIAHFYFMQVAVAVTTHTQPDKALSKASTRVFWRR